MTASYERAACGCSPAWLPPCKASFPHEPISSEKPELDALLGDALRRGTSTLLIGPSDVGKSTLAIQIALAAARRGERAARFAFDESYRPAADRALRLGEDLDGVKEAGRLSWTDLGPTTLSPCEFVSASSARSPPAPGSS